ncbi:bifunctional hydroxymethylpyrimidine kinase/phosphomethylpyrimidine kinase, partial [bacterium]|nr:bifunctional hydroxymethylpyrimidine kinase/phosphomethylpyrimidine kinase [bacterium]
IGADAVKTGMLFNAGIVQTVSEKIRGSRIPHVVVDPVMVAKSGDRLLEDDAVELFKSRLLPLATLVTPNFPEAEALSGLRLQSEEDIQKAAHRILQLGCRAVLIKGGHGLNRARDILFDGNEFLSFTEDRVQTLNTHGTGCTLSAAIAAHLALGCSLEDAVSRGKRYVTEAIRTALALGHGHGPLNHMVRLS